jgi:hypothetical protein
MQHLLNYTLGIHKAFVHYNEAQLVNLIKVLECCCALAGKTGGPPAGGCLHFFAPLFASRQKVEKERLLS